MFSSPSPIHINKTSHNNNHNQLNDTYNDQTNDSYQKDLFGILHEDTLTSEESNLKSIHNEIDESNNKKQKN